MNAKNFELASLLVSSGYVKQAAESRHIREGLITSLLSQRRLPQQGWDETSIELFLAELSMMDSNNFPGAAGVGEREARIHSGIVSRRYFGLGHGVGRSGDIAAEQPKACGSSIIQKLTNYLTLDAIRFDLGLFVSEFSVLLELHVQQPVLLFHLQQGWRCRYHSQHYVLCVLMHVM